MFLNRSICKIFASSSPEVPVSSCGDGWESLKKRIMRWEGDMRKDAREVAVFSSSDLREIADDLLPPRWKKQDERCKDLCYFCLIQRDLLKSSDWFISFRCPRWTCCKLRIQLNWRNTGYLVLQHSCIWCCQDLMLSCLLGGWWLNKQSYCHKRVNSSARNVTKALWYYRNNKQQGQ